MTCPACGTKQLWETARFGRTFLCVSCHEELSIPDFYTKRILIASALVALLFLLAIGQRGISVLFIAALICFPVSIVVGSIIRHVWPPVLQLQSGNDNRSITR